MRGPPGTPPFSTARAQKRRSEDEQVEKIRGGAPLSRIPTVFSRQSLPPRPGMGRFGIAAGSGSSCALLRGLRGRFFFFVLFGRAGINVTGALTLGCAVMLGVEICCGQVLAPDLGCEL